MRLGMIGDHVPFEICSANGVGVLGDISADIAKCRLDMVSFQDIQ